MEKGASTILKETLQEEGIKGKKEKRILTEVHDKYEKERSRKLSVKEGSASSVMSGFGSDYVSAYALKGLNANNAEIGFLSALPNLISPIAQVFGSRLMEKYPRRRLMVLFAALQALMWLPIMSLSFLIWRNVFPAALPYMLIVLYTLLSVFGSLAGPPWFSLMGDLVPEKIRGKYFGNRNKICSSVELVSVLTAAFLLDYFKTKGMALVIFSILFFLAFVFRSISAGLLRKHYDPPFKLEEGYYFSFWQFIRKAWTNNFGRFVIFVALIQFASAIASPFFTVYMLKDLAFSYKTFIIVNFSSTVFTILFMPVWGKFSDKYGNRALLKLGAILIPLIPLLWIVNPSPVYLVLVPQLISGVAWAAFNLASSNFIYDCVSVSRRGICVAYYNVIVGAGAFAGASLGGLLAFYVNLSFINPILLVFLISGVARILSALAISYIKEVKSVKKAKFSPILLIREIHPVKGVLDGVTNDMMGLGKIFKRKFKP